MPCQAPPVLNLAKMATNNGAATTTATHNYKQHWEKKHWEKNKQRSMGLMSLDSFCGLNNRLDRSYETFKTNLVS